MKKSFIVLAMLAFSFTACNKDNNSAPAPVKKYLQSIVSGTGDSIAVEYTIDRYMYRQVVSSKTEGTTAYMPTLDAEGRTTQVTIYAGANLTESYNRAVVNYKGKGMPAIITFYNYDGGFSASDSLTYKNNIPDTLYQSEWDYETKQPRLVKKFAYTWDGQGNIIQLDKIYVDDPANVHVTTTTFVYDNKINPIKALTGYYIINFDEEELPAMISANNILTSSSSNKTTGYTASSENTYTYDDGGYPLTMTLRSTSKYVGEDTRTNVTDLKLHYGN